MAQTSWEETIIFSLSANVISNTDSETIITNHILVVIPPIYIQILWWFSGKIIIVLAKLPPNNHPLPLPFVSCCSFRYFLPFASTLLSCSSCSSFPFNSSISWHPSFRCNLSLPFVTSFLSFQNIPPVRLPLPFVSSRSFYFIIPSVSTCTSRVIADLKKMWLQVAGFLNFNYPAFCNNVTVSNPGLVRLPPWNPRKYGSDGLGAPQ